MRLWFVTRVHRRTDCRARAAALLAAAAVLAPVSVAVAQQPSTRPGTGPTTTPQSGQTQQQAPATKPAPKGSTSAKQPGESGSESGRGSEAALRQRVEQLEEQLVDMQIVIGTLESLAKSGVGAAGAPARAAPLASPAGSADVGRIEALETQIRALTAQVEQLANELRSAGRRSGAVSGGGGDVASRDPGTPSRSQVGGFAQSGGAPPGNFGSVTVTPEQTASNDPIGRIITGPGGDGVQQGALPPPGDATPKQLYEAAYGYLLQQDYGAAEAAFDDFLKRHPNDPLAGNAQYWLGESYFVRGQFRAAANAFLKGYQTYGRSAKAPDSLLKLAMSLDRLGQKDAACSSYNELSTKFPTAPAHVKNRAQTERQRLGCA